MIYASVNNLIERYGADELAQRADRQLPRLVTPVLLSALANRDSENLNSFSAEAISAGKAAIAIIDRALFDATDCINSYLAGRYSLPLTHIPNVLNRVACELARYYLYDDMVTELIKERYQASIKFLRDVSEGKTALGMDAAGARPPSSSLVKVVTGSKIFSRENGTGFI